MQSRLPLTTHRNLARIAFAVLVLAAAGPLASRPSLQSVRLIVEDGVTSVILSADGALPSPKVGVLTDPPRIYLDFGNVAAATEGIRVEGSVLVRGVRVAVNQSEPLVTRVVIDLSEPAPHRVEAGRREFGQLTVLVGVPVAVADTPKAQAAARDVAGGAPSAPLPPSTTVPEIAARTRTAATAPAVPSPVPAALPPEAQPDAAARAARSPGFARAGGGTAARAPAKDVAQYLHTASPLLQRLERLRPVLVKLDALAIVPDERLTSAVEEFGLIRTALASLVPPRSLTATHDLLRDACILGATSATARVAPGVPDDSSRAWNAAAAAAGAIMLLDRARADLGLAADRSPADGGWLGGASSTPSAC
jgi:hypothetical protein